MLNNSIVPLSHYRKWLIPFQDEKTRKFIQLAQSLHGDRYDYRFVKIFNRLKDKICILCKKHGEFWQGADEHASNHSHKGCPKCGIENRANNNRLTFKDFIERSIAAHPNENYDYSKVNYIKSDIPVEIVCSKHGPFFQQPVHHWSGCGCPKCAKERMGEQFSFTTEEWIFRAKELHGDDYDYSETIYVNSHTKVKIHCNKCGNDFWQVAAFHLNSGGGCPTCSKKEGANKQKLSWDEFLERSTKVYPPDKYDYSKSEYKNYFTPILIYCNDCNTWFYQSPRTHLDGCCGCECNKFTADKVSLMMNERFDNRYELIKSSFTIYSEKAKFIDHELNDIIIEISPIVLMKRKVDNSISSGEYLVMKWLTDNNIEFEMYYEVKDIIKNKQPVKIDFRIIIDNIEIWIEYNGLQHYEFISYFCNGCIENFKSQLDRDNKVRNYCKKKNIHLIEIPYTYNTEEQVSDFMEKSIINKIDPYSFVNYESLFKRPDDYIFIDDDNTI